MSYLETKKGSLEEAIRKHDEDYKALFKKELEKTGKSIPQMTPDEKKKFFNKIDKMHSAKNEAKVDELTKAQKKLPPALQKAIKKKEMKEEQISEMKKVEIKLHPQNIDNTIQKIVKHIDIINRNRVQSKKIDVQQNMSDDSVTLIGRGGSDVGREVKDIRNFIGFKSAKVVESVEEENLDEGRYVVHAKKQGKKPVGMMTMKHYVNNAKNEKDAIKQAIAMSKQGLKGDEITAKDVVKVVKEGKMSQIASYIDDIANAMSKDSMMKPFITKFKADARKTLNPSKSLEKILPDYVPGQKIAKLLNMSEAKSGKVDVLKTKLAKEKDTDALEKQITQLTGQLALAKQQLENEKNKAIKPEPNPDTGEVPLTVGVAYKHLRDKMKKEQDKKKGTMTGKKPTKIDTDPEVEFDK